MEKLPRAPIDEVIVGFGFGTSNGLDPVEVGRYWSARASAFKTHEFHEPIVPPNYSGDLLGPRVWLVSEDETVVVQIQYDRLIVNWRRRANGVYPGFTTERGVRDFALEELASYLRFWGELKGAGGPVPVTVELAKIDLLIHGKHWSSFEELVALVPALGGPAFMINPQSPGPMINLISQEQQGNVLVGVSMQASRLRLEPNTFAYRLDFKATAPATDRLDTQLAELSVILNDVFARVIPDHRRRFGDA